MCKSFSHLLMIYLQSMTVFFITNKKHEWKSFHNILHIGNIWNDKFTNYMRQTFPCKNNFSKPKTPKQITIIIDQKEIWKQSRVYWCVFWGSTVCLYTKSTSDYSYDTEILMLRNCRINISWRAVNLVYSFLRRKLL